MKSLEILNELRELNKTKDKKSYYDAIEKDLEILKIIREDPSIVFDCWCYKNFHDYMKYSTKFLLNCNHKELEKKFNIIKGWLKDEENK